MSRKKILITCLADPRGDPRPNRMISWLKDDYDVTVLSQTDEPIDGVITYSYIKELKPDPIKHNSFLKKTQNIIEKIKIGYFVDESQYFYKILNGNNDLIDSLKKQNFDLIITHDCTLIPIVFSIKSQKTKILFDAREFYPRQYEDIFFWRLYDQPLAKRIIKKYIKNFDKIIAPSTGCANEYNRVYGVNVEVMLSLPDFFDLKPTPVNSKNIKIIHHGIVGPSRKIEKMIEMMDYLDENYHLDLMLIPNGTEYWNFLLNMVNARDNVSVIPPVKMKEIIPHTNKYDIGLFLLNPTNFNLKTAMPNKLFEFIQARLMVAIGPNPCMSQLVREYDCGLISNDYSPKKIAEQIKSLSIEDIMRYKLKSHIAANNLHAGINQKRILEIVEGLCQN
ncbi:hypothetical protein DSECCO2_52030 [anaerobic digester metagenome]